MTEYAKAKARVVEAISDATISGVPLEDLHDGPARIKGGRIPILGCLCVHDAPDNSCTCRDLIGWLPVDQVGAFGPSKRRSATGQEIFDFHVPRSGHVIAE
jgi:hypothetical protein